MTKQNNAARVAVQAKPCPKSTPSSVPSTQAADLGCQQYDAEPLDLHALHLQQSQGGYDRQVVLTQHEASSMAGCLRGLIAVTAVLQAAGDSDSLKLGDWLKGGLLDAVHELAVNTQFALEAANSRAEDEAEVCA